jgi:hypothetical protein
LLGRSFASGHGCGCGRYALAVPKNASDPLYTEWAKAGEVRRVLHVARCVLHVACCMLRAACCVLHAASLHRGCNRARGQVGGRPFGNPLLSETGDDPSSGGCYL